MRHASANVFALCCVLCTACGSSHDRDPRVDAGGATDAGARDASRRDGGILPGVDAGARSCGGLAEESCAPSEWCDYPDGSFCGGDDSTGFCRPRPGACDRLYDPVCGCDGVTYGNECAANAAGMDVQSRGECPGSGGAVCTNDVECVSGVCTGSSCGEVWRCVETGIACTDDEAPHCGCDGVTFYDSSTCPRQPVMFRGSCEDGVSCDQRFVLCDALPPRCPAGQTPWVSGGCWGGCADVRFCTCASTEECPAELTCGSGGRCG